MRRRSGFTLVEVLVAIGIIALLIGILVPAVVAARESARLTQCASNLRQVAAGLVNYASDNRGEFPANRGVDHLLWCNEELTGKYFRGSRRLPDGTLGGGVLVCPGETDERAARSYSMNVWGSSRVSDLVWDSQNATPPKGKLFGSGSKPGERLILAIESLWQDAEVGMEQVGTSPAVVGWVGRPGERFGAGKGGEVILLRYGVCPCQLDYGRHRTWRERGAPEQDVRGRLNVAFLDGHVRAYRAEELADFGSGKSRYEAMWSSVDREGE